MYRRTKRYQRNPENKQYFIDTDTSHEFCGTYTSGNEVTDDVLMLLNSQDFEINELRSFLQQNDLLDIYEILLNKQKKNIELMMPAVKMNKKCENWARCGRDAEKSFYIGKSHGRVEMIREIFEDLMEKSQYKENNDRWINEIKKYIDCENDKHIIKFCLSYTLQSLRNGENLDRFKWNFENK